MYNDNVILYAYNNTIWSALPKHIHKIFSYNENDSSFLLQNLQLNILNLYYNQQT